jgi:hypothetical protein
LICLIRFNCLLVCVTGDQEAVERIKQIKAITP